jgi:hypothetical protein
MDLKKVKQRQEDLGISSENISKILKISLEDVENFFNSQNTNSDTIYQITKLLGLDENGNEVINIQTVKEKRAEQRALYVVSLVQDSASLEMQGLEEDQIQELLEQTKQDFLIGDYQESLWRE